MVELKYLYTKHVLISPRVCKRVASFLSGKWLEILKCISLLSVSTFGYLRLERRDVELGAARRNPDRKGRSSMKREAWLLAPAPQPPLGCTAGMTHLFIPGPEGRRGRMGRSCYTCRGVAGASSGGIQLKVRQADLPVTSA